MSQTYASVFNTRPFVRQIRSCAFWGYIIRGMAVLGRHGRTYWVLMSQALSELRGQNRVWRGLLWRK